MNKAYTQIVFPQNVTLVEAITKLMEYAAKGEFVCGKFNGVMLYSDTVSFDSAFKQVAGLGYFEMIAADATADEETVNRYILMGQQLIQKELWADWEQYVRSSMTSVYHGTDVACALAVMTDLAKPDVDMALNTLSRQSHDKTSFKLVLSIIRTFSRYGDEFVDIVRNKLAVK